MALNRDGISTAFIDMLKADTTTLYGTGKLLQYITSNPIEFENAKVDRNKPYCLFVQSEPESSLEIRPGNTYEDFTINLVFHGSNVNPYDAYKNMDQAYEQVKSLTNRQMWSIGTVAAKMMEDYYTDSTAQIYNIEPTSSSLPPPEDTDDSQVTIILDGAILVQINRWVN